MVDAIDPEGLRMFATASEEQLEALRIGFVRYLSEKSGVESPEHEEVFRAFVRKDGERYLKSKVH